MSTWNNMLTALTVAANQAVRQAAYLNTEASRMTSQAAVRAIEIAKADTTLHQAASTIDSMVALTRFHIRAA